MSNWIKILDNILLAFFQHPSPHFSLQPLVRNTHVLPNYTIGVNGTGGANPKILYNYVQSTSH